MPKKSPLPDLVIPELSLSEYLFTRIRKYGKEIAMIDNTNDHFIAFDEIHHQSKKLAAALFQKGLRKGDVVGICSSSCIEYAIILLATSSCGAALTTCNPDYTVDEMTLQFGQTLPKVIFSEPGCIERIKNVCEQLAIQCLLVIGEKDGYDSMKSLIDSSNEEDFPRFVDINPKQDVVWMPYSSGTTGFPKCVMHTHYSYVAFTRLIGAWNHAFRSCCFYSERPMFHVGGIYGLLVCLGSGCKLVIDSCFEVERFLRAIEKFKVTHTSIVPPGLISLVNKHNLQEYDLSSLKHVLCGGANVPHNILRGLEAKLGTSIRQSYGLTECTISSEDPVHSRISSSGLIGYNTEVKIIDTQTGAELGEYEDGEILVKAPQMMIGYYKNPEATNRTIDKDGWLHTGDLGHYDTDGMMYITGRLKEIIKYRSYQISPSEVKNCLLKHPKIADAGVIGISHPEAGEIPRAMVVRKDETLTKDEVESFVKENLSEYKHLKGGVQFINEIPKSSTGKICRGDLANMFKI